MTPPAVAGAMKVVFVDVGQGAAVIIQLPDAVILNDVGRNSLASAGAIKAALQTLGVTEVDAIIVTNPDADHAGGCNDIYQAYPVAALYHPGTPKDTITWRECLDAAKAEGTAVYTDAQLNPGDYLPVSQQATIRVLNIAQDAENVNSGSLAIRVDFGSVSWIFPGDIECDEETEIQARGYDLDVDLIQAAHHGSSGSTCAAWLQATTPEAAFIPVGTGNTYGHPTQATLDRLAAIGADVYRTDLQGTITVTSDGTTWSVSTSKATTATSSTTASATSTTTVPPPPPVTGGVSIVDIEHDAAGSPDDAANAHLEWVEVCNAGSASQGMSGWRIEDVAGNNYPFPSAFTLAAGACVKVRSGGGTDSATDLYWGRSQHVWNQDHDTAYLYSGTTLVDSRSY